MHNVYSIYLVAYNMFEMKINKWKTQNEKEK